MNLQASVSDSVASRDVVNPYWDAVRDLVTHKGAFSWETGARYVGSIDDWTPMKDRFERTSQYAWTITAPDTVAFVAEYIGESAIDPMAGSGYWAFLLAQLGIDVSVADIKPGDSQWHHNGTWLHIPELDAVTAVSGSHPSRTLLLSWPPYDLPLGAEVLRSYRGSRVIYIGEGEGGCCGDDAMFELLREEWTEVVDHRPVQWYGLHDWVTVYDRKHEHGFTFREGLGYLADDPFCDGCCELATAKWKSSWKRPTTDAEQVTADVDAKTAEAAEL